MTRRIKRLNIWMNGQYVGYWEKPEAKNHWFMLKNG